MASMYGLSERSGRYYGFTDPYRDMASLAMPKQLTNAFKWCEKIVLRNGSYRQALNRVLSYFITDIDITDADDMDKEKYEDFLNDTLGISKILNIVGLDYLAYGNAFVSVVLPVDRKLLCKKCSFKAPLRVIHDNPIFEYEFRNFKFYAHCKACGYQGEWIRHDKTDKREGSLVIKRWSPYQIAIKNNLYTDKNTYIWKIPEYYRDKIRKGSIEELSTAPWHVVEAVKHEANVQFDDDVIFHIKEENLAGFDSKGWGVSRVLTNFGQAWYVQLLRRFNEAVAVDFIVPFRLLSPAPGKNNESDPIMNNRLDSFVSRMTDIVKKHKMDPNDWHVAPYAAQYQAIGGEANQLAPTELMNQGLEVLLHDIGVPVELFRGSLQVQSAPTALRLFESSWSPLVYNLNSLLRFIVNRVSYLLGWQPVKATMLRVRHADDLNQQMATLQLMSTKDVAPSTGLKAIGLDLPTELRKKKEDQKLMSKIEVEMQEDMDQIGMAQQIQQGIVPGGPGDPNAAAAGGGGGMMPPGGGPPPGGGGDPGQMTTPGLGIAAQWAPSNNQKVSPQEMMATADSMADQLLSQPESIKDSELRSLKNSDPYMHALVSKKIEEKRQKAKTVGGAMVMSQQYGQG